MIFNLETTKKNIILAVIDSFYMIMCPHLNVLLSRLPLLEKNPHL